MPRKPAYRPSRDPERTKGPRVTAQMRDEASVPAQRFFAPRKPRGNPTAAAPLVPVEWTSNPTPPDGQVGVAYFYDLTPHLNTTVNVVITVSAGGNPLPSGLSISGLTIVGTPDTVEQVTEISLDADNGFGSEESFPFNIEIIVAAPVWTTNPPNPPDGQDGVTYPGHDFQADVDITSTFAVTAGVLPSGLSLAANGLLTGTPDTVGTQSNIQVTATSVGGSTECLAFDIETIVAAPVWTTDPPVVPKAIDGDAFTYDFEPDLNSGAGVVLTVTAGVLPSGLAISGLTVTGTPDTAETQAGIQITATNNGGVDECLPFSMQVVAQSANFIDNSRWNNMSGSVGGADFVSPTDWDQGFFPPDDAVAVAPGGTHPDALACQFIAIGNRGYLSFDFDSTDYVGVEMNLSCFVDAVAVATTQSVLQVSGNVDIIAGAPNLGLGFVGRTEMVIKPNGPSITLRVGAGVKSNMTGDFTLSRPQFTAGDTLRTYSQTAAPLLPFWTTDPPNPPDGTDGEVYAGYDFQNDVDLTSTFAVTAGTLPSGLSLSGAGVLSGTPDTEETQAGIVVTATTAGGSTASMSFDIDIAAAGESLGPELLTNGSFTGNANGWSLGTGWSYASNQVSSNGATAGDLSQNVGLATGVANYRLTFEITANSQDAGLGLRVRAGSGTILDNVGAPTGAKSMIIATSAVLGTDLTFLTQSNGDWAGSIDDISLKLIL